MPGSSRDAAGLRQWLAALVAFGSGWNDAVLFAEAWRRAKAGGDLDELAELGEALAGSRERHAETMLQGAAFRAASHERLAASGPRSPCPTDCPYAVAVGAAAGAHGLPLEPALAVFLQAFAANLAQAAIRLGVTGQNGAVSVIAALEGDCARGRRPRGKFDARRSRLGGDRLRDHVDAARNPLFQAVPLMIVLAVILTLVLAAIAALHVYWGFGGIWPGRDAADCAAAPAAFAAHAPCPVRPHASLWPLRSPSRRLIPIFARRCDSACWPALAGLAVALVFLGRGVAGFTPAWRRLTPEQPFATARRPLLFAALPRPRRRLCGTRHQGAFAMTSPNGPLRVGIGGPVGSGKTTLTEKLCKALRDEFSIAVVTNDIYTKEDAMMLARLQALPEDRIMGVETGGCPHTAIREDASINLQAIAAMRERHPDLDIVFIESGGDNLAATFSPDLADLTLYVISVCQGEEIPRKGGPGITRSDFLVINKSDLAPYVNVNLDVMQRDAAKMRGARPFGFTDLSRGKGLQAGDRLHRREWRAAHERGKLGRLTLHAATAAGPAFWHCRAIERAASSPKRRIDR